MRAKLFMAIMLMLGICDIGSAMAQQRGQAASPGQTRAVNRVRHHPSAGRPTGLPAAGPQTSAERDAEAHAKKSTGICKGC